MRSSPVLRKLYVLLIVCYSLVVLLLDYVLPTNIAVGALYSITVFSASFIFADNRKSYWGVVFFCTVLLVLGFFVSEESSDYHTSIFNRAVSFAVIWMSGILGRVTNVAQEKEIFALELLRQKNTELRRVNEELSQFAYRTSHDLKASLITIQGLARYIEQDIETNALAEAKSNLQKIIKQSAKLEQLVGDILNLAKIDFTERVVEKVDLRAVVDEVVEALSGMITKNNVHVSTDIQMERDFLSQRVPIFQVLENLISNGVKYCDLESQNRYVKVFAKELERGSLLQVSDNGRGIPQKHQQNVFKMFTRFHPDVAFGSGLGLSIVKKHLDRLGAKIQFSSSDRGTSFEIFFP